ncbi:hypothetical protein ABH966_002176 [Lysinibacillus sp. RC46]|uniref:hypothetical protein n=1 Tax=unclassified Lysinibacillus TaxID=2636778 RepID=UPI0035188487
MAITYKEKPAAKVDSTEDATWQDKVEKVASFNSTPSKKLDTVDAFAKKYPATKA